MSQHTAEEQAQILNDITHPLATKEDLSRLEAKMDQFATKEDLSRLEARMGEQEARMDKRFTSLQWTIGIMFVALGLIIAALKIL